ncbi:MAG: hypothetical protein JJ858_08510 [Rhizobiaceae bacterium]|nr:hypothetical protein [Rhizobiaceae bacterium]
MSSVAIPFIFSFLMAAMFTTISWTAHRVKMKEDRIPYYMEIASEGFIDDGKQDVADDAEFEESAKQRSSTNSGQIPSQLKFDPIPDPMRCSVGDPFAASWHTKGQSSGKVKINSTLYIICPTRKFKWNGYTIPINWFDRFGNAYTDCDWKTDGFHRCWITIPDDQIGR